MCEDVCDDAMVVSSLLFIISDETEQKKKNLSITTKTSEQRVGNSSHLENNHLIVCMLSDKRLSSDFLKLYEENCN